MSKGFFRRAAALGCALLLCGGRALAEEFYTINEVRQQAAAGWHETYEAYRRTIVADVEPEIPNATQIPIEKLEFARMTPRVTEEETGLHAQNWQLLVDMDTTPGFCNEHIGIYLATGLSQHHMHTDEDEFLNVDRVPLSEAVRRVMAGEIHDSKTIAGLMMAWNLLGRQSDMPLDSLASIQRGSTAFASQAKE